MHSEFLNLTLQKCVDKECLNLLEILILKEPLKWNYRMLMECLVCMPRTLDRINHSPLQTCVCVCVCVCDRGRGGRGSPLVSAEMHVTSESVRVMPMSNK